MWSMKFAAYAMPSYRTEFGLTQGEFLRATLEHLVEAERLGFDSIWPVGLRDRSRVRRARL